VRLPAAAVLSLGLALAATARADDAVVLKWNLSAGDKFYAKSTQNIEQTIEVMGQKVPQKIKAVMVTRYEVLAVDNGATVVKMTYTAVEMDTAGLPGAGAVAERFKNGSLTATMDKDFAVTKLDGYDKLIDQLSEGDPAQRKIFAAMIPEATGRMMFTQVFNGVPGRKVSTGGTWAKTDKVPVAGLGEMTCKSKFTLASVSGGVAKIEQTADLTFQIGGGGPLPFKITKADLKVDDFAGTVLFDATAGRLKEAKTTMRMSGTMTIAAGGQEHEAKLEQKATTTVVVTDKNPVVD